MRIAIVGAGVSGLVAAYLLNRQHEIEIFEARAAAGGHANNVLAPQEDGDPIPLDVGFVVYNERTYPHFTRLLRDLEVETQASDMSFGVRVERDDFEFSSRGLRGYLAQPRNAISATHLRMGLDVLRFQREGRAVLLQRQMRELPFAEYLERRGYSRPFKERIIIPLIASTWSNAPSDVLSFPTYYLLRFLEQHGVLAWNNIPEWRWIQGGSRRYVQRILESLAPSAVHLDAPIAQVRRDEDGVDLWLRHGGTLRFDAVVLACHANHALRLLADPSEDERDVLGGFSYTRNQVALHTDQHVLPRNPHARAAWNFHVTGPRGIPDTLTMSYDLNRLQGILGETRYCVSVNPSEDLDPSRVIATVEYEHIVYTLETLKMQRRLEALQGERRTYYAGAHLGYGFHEDGAASGVRVAARLGVTW
jgi:uncharacterized protein